MGRTRAEIRRFKAEFFKTVSTLVISAFSLVAALAWNTAITKILERYLSLQDDAGISSWFIYAGIVTAIAVIVTVYVGGLAQKFVMREEDNQDK